MLALHVLAQNSPLSDREPHTRGKYSLSLIRLFQACCRDQRITSVNFAGYISHAPRPTSRISASYSH